MAKQLADYPLALTVEEAAECLRISRGSAYELVRTGGLPHLRLGRRIVIPRAMLAQLLGEVATEAHNGDARHTQHAWAPERDDGRAEVGA